MQTKCRTDIEKIMRKCTVRNWKSLLPWQYQRRFTLLCFLFLFFPFFFLKDIYFRRTIGLYFQSWISPYIGPPAEVLYKFTSLFCESHTHSFICGVNTTDPNIHRNQPLQHLSLLLQIWFLEHTFHLSSSPLHQKILKSVIQCLQTSTIVALCWDLDLWDPISQLGFLVFWLILDHFAPASSQNLFWYLQDQAAHSLCCQHIKAPQCPRMGWVSWGTGKLLLALLLTHLSQRERLFLSFT